MIPDGDSYLQIASINFEDFFEYMWIDAAKKILVSTVVVSVVPLRATAMPGHYELTTPNQVRVKLAWSDEWMIHDIRRDKNILWWTIRDKCVPWNFISFDDIPQWAHDAFARGKAKLEENI